MTAPSFRAARQAILSSSQEAPPPEWESRPDEDEDERFGFSDDEGDPEYDVPLAADSAAGIDDLDSESPAGASSTGSVAGDGHTKTPVARAAGVSVLPISARSAVYAPRLGVISATVETMFPTPAMMQSSERLEFVQLFGPDLVMRVEHELGKAVLGLEKRQPFFREKDVRRALMRPLQQAASGRQYRDARGKMHTIDPDPAVNALLVHPRCEDLLSWAIGQYPFAHLKIPGVLTTVRTLKMERSILDISAETHDVFAQDLAEVEKAIARKKGISDEQIAAVHAATLSSKRVSLIEGSAGSGKTYSMETIKEVYQAAGYNVIGTALGWNAAKVLAAGAKMKDSNCRALEGLTRSMLRAVEAGSDPFSGPTLLIVDEAGMVGTRHMSIILEMAQRSVYPVKVILSGDSLQVIPVDAGNPMEMIIQFEGTTRIDTIRRQSQPSQRAAVANFSRKRSGAAIHTFLQQECFHWGKDKDAMLNQVVQDYISYRVAYPDREALVLSLTNADVLELNQRIRAVYRKLGLIGTQDIEQRVTDGQRSFQSQFSVGDEVLLRSNDQNMIVYEIDETKSPVDERSWKPLRLGVFNRNSGRIVAIRRAKAPVGAIEYVVDLGGDTPGRVIVNSETFKSPEVSGLPMVHNYAGTTYGSQGRTVDHVLLLDSDRMDFRLAYVGMSRHRGSVAAYLNESDLHRRMDKAMARTGSLEARLAMDRKGKSMDDAKVDTGRYTRKAMLQTVSQAWSKHSENLTCTMYELISAQGRRNVDQPQPNIQPESQTPWVTDFVRTHNLPYPQVDVAKILNLPDPVGEAELFRPSDVEENKSHYSPLEMPVDEAATPMPMSMDRADLERPHPGMLRREPTAETSFFGGMASRAASWVMGMSPWGQVADRASASEQTTNGAPSPESWSEPPVGVLPSAEAAVPPSAASGGSAGATASPPLPLEASAASAAPRRAPVPKPSRLEDPSSPFADVEGVSGDSDSAPSATPPLDVLAKLNAWLRPRVKVAVPYVNEKPHSCGLVLFPPSDPEFEKACRENGTPDPRPHVLSFEGVPQVLNAPGGPDPDWLASQRGLVWDVGRFSEPRILARGRRGEVAARYRMDGTCVVGNGEPVAWVNQHGDAHSPIYIVAGAKEYLWLRETMERRHADAPEAIPHIIWAAKDMDWSLIAPDMKLSRQIIVVRSKSDDRQIPWARDVQDMLKGRHELTAIISPPLPTNEERIGPNRFERTRRSTRSDSTITSPSPSGAPLPTMSPSAVPSSDAPSARRRGP